MLPRLLPVAGLIFLFQVSLAQLSATTIRMGCLICALSRSRQTSLLYPIPEARTRLKTIFRSVQIGYGHNSQPTEHGEGCHTISFSEDRATMRIRNQNRN
jgi:hypothetical protein